MNFFLIKIYILILFKFPCGFCFLTSILHHNMSEVRAATLNLHSPLLLIWVEFVLKCKQANLQLSSSNKDQSLQYW